MTPVGSHYWYISFKVCLQKWALYWPEGENLRVNYFVYVSSFALYCNDIEEMAVLEIKEAPENDNPEQLYCPRL